MIGCLVPLGVDAVVENQNIQLLQFVPQHVLSATAPLHPAFGAIILAGVLWGAVGEAGDVGAFRQKTGGQRSAECTSCTGDADAPVLPSIGLDVGVGHCSSLGHPCGQLTARLACPQ